MFQPGIFHTVNTVNPVFNQFLRELLDVRADQHCAGRYVELIR